MNPHFKIIKYKFNNLSPAEDLLNNEFQQDLYMLVSYQQLGENNDRICISMFEFNIRRFKINPKNFVIVSQKLNTKQN